jgi:hypothetical protein
LPLLLADTGIIGRERSIRIAFSERRRSVWRIALVLNGLIFTLVGVQTLLDPAAMLANFDIELLNPAALAHERSIQGGGMASVGVLMWLGLLRPDFRRPALVAAAFVMWGFALGRLLGVIVDGATESVVLFGTGMEALLGSLAVVALMREEPATSDPARQ